MKTLKFLLLAVLLGLNLVSCDPPTISDEVGIDEIENAFFTGGDNENVEEDVD